MIAPAGAKVFIGIDVNDHRFRHKIAMFLSQTCNEADGLIAQMTALSGDNNDAPLDRRVKGP
ncbi:hypothetical protein JCM18909A_02230 [Cutibacterium acnes subsp. elongatum]|jgi:hypothetical protein